MIGLSSSFEKKMRERAVTSCWIISYRTLRTKEHDNIVLVWVDTLYFQKNDNIHKIDSHHRYHPPRHDFDIPSVFGTIRGSIDDRVDVVEYLHCVTSNSTVFDKWYNGHCIFVRVVPSDNLDIVLRIVPSDTDLGRHFGWFFASVDYRPWYWYNIDSIPIPDVDG